MGDNNPSSNDTNHDRQYDGANDGTAPAPTVAAFSPNQQTASKTRNQKSVLIHQKSPLLVATPPQVTRTLAYSHPFILPLNHLVGLLSWTTDDPWESFLLLSLFWFVVLYGDDVVRWAGPLVIVANLIFGMYSRRYSPLSSTAWSGRQEKRKRADSETQRKSLDEILHTLQTFTNRCDMLLDPFLRLTEYLSTQSTATSATTRPALTTLFLRILAFTPFWIALTLPPLRLITTKRVVLTLGTIFLSYHSRPARVTRTILWRSRTVRQTITFLTGLQLPSPSKTAPPLPPRPQDAAARAQAGKQKPGVTFTFTIFENERRWWGLGWTKSLLAYERQAYTDDQLNECPSPDSYVLPETDNATTKWRWVVGCEWKVEGAVTEKEKSAKRIGGGGGGDGSGWTYYDNKWQDGMKVDGWGRYTRRRKWGRDAELVESDPNDTSDTPGKGDEALSIKDFAPDSVDGAPTTPSTRQRKGIFGGGAGGGGKKPPRQSEKNKSVDSVSISGKSADSKRSRASAGEEDVHTPLEQFRQYEWDRSINEGLTEQLS